MLADLPGRTSTQGALAVAAPLAVALFTTQPPAPPREITAVPAGRTLTVVRAERVYHVRGVPGSTPIWI